MQYENKFLDPNFDADNYEWSAEAIEEGRRELITWDQIMTCARILPELEHAGHDEIRKHLGYLPNPSAYMQHEVFIRALIDQFRKKQLSETEFNEQVAVHVKLIRNDDVLQGGYVDYLEGNTPLDMERYDRHFRPYKEKARNRLKFLLGNEPDLRYSLYAELMLRELCAMDWYIDDMAPVAIDYKAITVMQYRKAMCEHGKAFADDIPVMAF